MKKLIIFTAEPENYVPVELKKAADANSNIESCIILDANKCVVTQASNQNPVNQIFVVKDDNLEHVVVDTDTYIIPRLNEYHLDVKLGILKMFEIAGAKLINTSNSMELCNDKFYSQILLNIVIDSLSVRYVAIDNIPDIKIPKSFLCNDNIELVTNQFIENGELQFPIIIKTLRGTHGIGVMKIDSQVSLISVIQYLHKEKVDFLIQEFIEHKESIRVIMLGDKVLAANKRRQPEDKVEFRTNSHLGSKTEKYIPSDYEVEMAQEIVKDFGCNFCAIDYILQNNEIILLEVNGSPGLEFIQKDCGDKDLTKEIIDYICCICISDLSVNPETELPAEIPTASQTEIELPTNIVDSSLKEVENCTIYRLINNTECRIDTGATYCSINVSDIEISNEIVKFTRDNTRYIIPFNRMIKIKDIHGGESIQRPIVNFDITIKGQRHNNVEFTLNDRTHMKYEVLIGRNLIGLLNLPVTVNSVEQHDEKSVESEVEEE